MSDRPPQYTDYSEVLQKPFMVASKQAQRKQSYTFDPVVIEGHLQPTTAGPEQPPFPFGTSPVVNEDVDIDSPLIDAAENQALEDDDTPPPLVRAPGPQPLKGISHEEQYPDLLFPPVTSGELLSPTVIEEEFSPARALGYHGIVQSVAGTPQWEFQRVAEEVLTASGENTQGAMYMRMMLALRRRRLSTEEVRRLLALLRESGRAKTFFTAYVAKRPELRKYLFDRGVTWQEVLDYYDFGVTDSLDFFGGVVAGVVKNAGDVAVMPLHIMKGIYTLTGSFFNEELARDRDAFLAALGKLLSVDGLQRVTKEWWDEFSAKCMTLQFFEAGGMLGNVLPDVIELGGALKNMPNLLRTPVRMSKQVVNRAKTTLSSLKRFMDPIDLRGLADALKTEKRAWNSSGSSLNGQFALTKSGDERVLVNIKTGEEFSLSDISDAEWQKYMSDVENLLSDTPNPNVRVPNPVTVDRVVNYPFDDLAQRLSRERPHVEAQVKADQIAKGQTVNYVAREVGRRLHERAKSILRQHFEELGEQVEIIADEDFSALLPPAAHNKTVAQFITEFGEEFPEIKGLKLPGSNGNQVQLGRLRPDLLYILKGRDEAVLADLMSRADVPHLKKTALYNAVLAKYRGIKHVTFGEYYYGDMIGNINRGTKSYERGLRRASKLKGSLLQENNTYADNIRRRLKIQKPTKR